jgi:hypothetical protein
LGVAAELSGVPWHRWLRAEWQGTYHSLRSEKRDWFDNVAAIAG